MACSNPPKQPLHMPKLTDRGVNSINENTLFETTTVAPKLLGYDVAIFTAFNAGFAKPIMRVTYHDTEVMLLIPSTTHHTQTPTVKKILITSNLLSFPFSERIGDTVNKKNFTTCLSKKEILECRKKAFQNLTFHYHFKQEQYRLKEIVWSLND